METYQDNEEKLDEEIEDEDEEEKEGKDLFKTETLNKVIKNPEILIKDQNSKQRLEFNKNLVESFNPERKEVHPGFAASFSFGEHEYERLKKLLERLDFVAERVMTYRKENLSYFPEFYAVINNLFTCIQFIIDTENRKKIKEGLNFVRTAVINYTTQNTMDVTAITILEEIYSLLSNIKNFHGLGFSYEKKKGQSERYHEAFFKRKPR